MEDPTFEVPEGGRARLRTIVDTIDRQLSCLPKPTVAGGRDALPGELAMCFAELVKLLALGPAPESRQCPICKHSGMRAATRCGYCWMKLAPLTPVSVGEVL